MIDLPLKTENNISFYWQPEKLDSIQRELYDFTYDLDYVKSHRFTKEILFTHELKSNNAIEGYYEDLSSIIKIVNNPSVRHNMIESEYKRIINLYNGYKYILQRPHIDENTLKELYKILSNNLLEEDEKLKANQLYRDNDVFIYFSPNMMIEPDKGFEVENIKENMDILFDYINSKNDMSKEMLFFKSQIIHFYMVYIHPYFDINGRTSRTTSLWFLNNKRAYSYTLFNRGIIYDKGTYCKFIRDIRKHKNITPFISFIAEKTKLELEKEYIVRNIEKNIGYNISPIDKQILQYIISNKSNNTLLDLRCFYNRFNPKKTALEINDEFLVPLMNQRIILKKEDTSKEIKPNFNNFSFEINKDVIDVDKAKIKRLNIDRFY